MKLSLLPLLCLGTATAAAVAHPNAKNVTSTVSPEAKRNIVIFMTDDQDQLLGASFPTTAPGGATPMPKAKAGLFDGGAHATNFMIHTPICCPSRAETMTGRYDFSFWYLSPFSFH